MAHDNLQHEAGLSEEPNNIMVVKIDTHDKIKNTECSGVVKCFFAKTFVSHPRIVVSTLVYENYKKQGQILRRENWGIGN